LAFLRFSPTLSMLRFCRRGTDKKVAPSRVLPPVVFDDAGRQDRRLPYWDWLSDGMPR
jgi:hypothetical protein